MPTSMEARQLFDMPVEDVYLACASRAPLARRTFEAGVRATAKKSTPWKLGSDGTDEQVREAFARLAGCSADDVALCPSTSFALTTAARAVALDMHAGDVGLILEDQMSSNTYPWQHLQRTRGLALEAVPYPRDGNWTAALLRRLAELDAEGRRVAVVAIPAVLWTDCSGPVDLVAVSEACRRHSRPVRTALVVDATQSLGVLPLDLRCSPVDFLAASVHKWLFGAYGLSCLYVAPRWWQDDRLEALVEDEHTRAHMASADDEVPFDNSLPGYPVAQRRGARRLDAGGRPNPIILPMALDGMRLVLEWGPGVVASALGPMTSRIRRCCGEELGLWVPAKSGPHFIGVGPGSADACRTPEDVAAWVRAAAKYLKERRVYVSGKQKVLRVAPHLYTSDADIEHFLRTLAAFVRQHRQQLLPATASAKL